MRRGRTGCRRILVVLTLILALLGEAGGGPAAEAPSTPGPTLRSLRFEGARVIPAREVREELTIPLPSRWPWRPLPAFNPGDLTADLERLEFYFRRRGFYHVRLTPEITTDESGRTDVVVKVEEGPWVQVTRVEVTGLEAIPADELDDLRAKIPLKIGDRFTEILYEDLKRLYLNWFLDHGYPRARLDGKVLLDEKLNTAQISLEAVSGPLCRFGRVELRGDLETPAHVILQKLTFKEGDLFSYDAIYESQRRLYGLDLFHSVTFIPQLAPATARSIPVTLAIEEKKKRSLKLGLGWGDEDQFRARASLRLRNLGGGGRLLDLEAKYSSLEYRVTGTFISPQLAGSRLDLIAESGLLRRYLPGFTDRAWYSQVRLERELPWNLRLAAGHGLEFARPFNIDAQTLLLLRETEPGKLYYSSMAFVGLRRDTTDNIADPRRGGLLTARFEAAPDFLGSSLQFVRQVVELRRYQAVADTNVVLAGRLKLGLIEPIQATKQIPIYKRFFSGGAGSVRGYRLDYLGPRDASGNPLGGEAVLEGSVEARLPIYKDFRAVAFLDFGNVFLKVRNVDLGQLKYASGVGLRYQTPVGPLGVDVGFPLNPIDPGRDRYHFHLTIGHAF
ncbi:MAG: hypothetical protein FJ128_02620 [Deltaproteobacteria bacterium]|nr:hypothetical protein [Deltaproteobacteria bacterium]